MIGRSTDPSMPVLSGEKQTKAMLGLQKELFDTYESAGRAWLDRVKTEVDFWSDLATKLSSSHSAPEAMETYEKGFAERMQMAAEDGKRLSEDCQKIMHKFTESMAAGWPTGNS